MKKSVTRWLDKYKVKNQRQAEDAVAIEEICYVKGGLAVDDPYTPLVSSGTRVGWRGRWTSFKRKAPYYVPAALWLPKYSSTNLFHDIVAGVSVGVMLVPQGLSYASLAGLPGVYGLYSACLPVMIYTFFGHCRELSVGPEAISSILVGTSIAQFAKMQEGEVSDLQLASYATVLSFLAGVFTLALGLLRFGFLSEILSRPLVRGFILAVAFTIIVEQLDSLLGLKIGHVEGWRKIPKIIAHWHEIQLIAVGMGFSSIAFLLTFNFAKSRITTSIQPPLSSTTTPMRTHVTNALLRLFHGIPPILVVVVLGISITVGLHLDRKGLSVLGEAPSGLPIPSFPPLNNIALVGNLIQPALIMSIIGFVETMAVAKFYAAEKNYQVSANRELVALGVANLFGSVVWAYPIFGSLTRSTVNSRAGARSQLSGFVTSLVILMTLLFLMPLFKYLPHVINNSILVVAGLSLVELHDIIFLWRVRAWKDLILLVSTCLVTFIFGASVGLMLSIGASVFIVIKHTSVPRVLVLGKMPDTGKYKDISQFPEAVPVTGVLLLRIEEALTFTNMNMLKEMMWRLEQLGDIKAHPTDPSSPDRISTVVLDIKSVPKFDPSSLQIVLEMVAQYRARGVQLCFANLRHSHKESFLRAGIIQLVGAENFFTSVTDAVQHLVHNIKVSPRSSYVL